MIVKIILWMVIYFVVVVPAASFVGKFFAYGLGSKEEGNAE